MQKGRLVRAIDFHVYCLPARLRDVRVNLPYTESAVRKAIHDHPDGEWVLKLSSVSAILESMQTSGIDQSTLIAFPWSDLGLCKENNDEVLGALAQHPEKFFAICSVQPNDKKFLEEAERCLKAGAIGIKINGDWQGFELDSGPVRELCRYLAKNNKILLTHVDQGFKKSPTSAAHLYSLAEKCPETKIVGAHMGGLLGLYKKLPNRGEKFKNLWFDTAVSESLEMVKYYCDSGLEDRILFGSDYPFNLCHSQKIVRERLQALGLSEDVQAKILSRNFMKLLKGNDFASC